MSACFSSTHRHAARNATTLRQFRDAAMDADAVCFDLFDTLLLRPVLKPADLFAHVIAGPAASDRRRFTELRIEAEVAARRRARECGLREEVTLGQIYDALERLSPDIRNAPALMKAEADLEIAASRVDVHVRKLVEELLDAGKPVYAVSDIYLDREVIAAMLARHKLSRLTNLFLSSEAGETKAGGGLWRQLREALNLPSGASIVHLGDNPHSDVEMATKHGVRGFLLHGPSSRAADFPLPARVGTEDVFDVSAACLRNRLSVLDPDAAAGWTEVAYHLAAPLALGFCQFLMDEARAAHSEAIHFAARDGRVFKKGFDTLFGEDAPPTNYMLASRRCLNISAMTQITDVDLRMIMVDSQRLGISGFVERFGLDPSQAPIRKKIALHEGQSSTRGNPGDALRRLAIDLKPEILANAAAERDILLAYLSSLGVFRDRALFVDLGWHGTLQRSLLKLAELNGTPAHDRIEGRYLGIFDNFVSGPDGAPLAMRGWLCDKAQPFPVFRMIKGACAVVELLFSAPEFGVERVVRTAEGFSARRIETEQERPRFAVAQIIHDAVVDVAGAARDLRLRIDPEVVRQEGLKRLTRLLEKPSAQEARAIGAIQHSVGFGRSSFRPICSPARPWTPRSLSYQLEHSLWMEGYLAQLDPARRVAAHALLSVQAWAKRIWRLLP